jgi:TetR/AcrR family transcriptional repressor of nem operon
MTSIILTVWMMAIIQNLMGSSKQDKAASRERIVATMAAQIRECGPDRPGVAEIMAAAGLTHGGFYKHFASRDELVIEAVARALVDSQTRIADIAASAEDPLAAFIEAYVSETHRDDPATGCGVAALGTDVARLGGPAQTLYAAQVARYVELLEHQLDGDDAQGRATLTLAAMVGAVTIARALGPTSTSDALLRDVREQLLGCSPTPATGSNPEPATS